MSEELNPCPFCNGGAQTYRAFPEHETPWFIDVSHSDQCILRTAMDGIMCCETEDEMAKAWNLRASNTLIEEQAARIAELQDELEREKKETERLDGAWHALHERMVKDNEGHARYFEKSQARIHELFDAEAASQARLSEAVKVLERIAANYEDGATFSGTQCADIASQFIATLGENKNEA